MHGFPEFIEHFIKNRVFLLLTPFVLRTLWGKILFQDCQGFLYGLLLLTGKIWQSIDIKIPDRGYFIARSKCAVDAGAQVGQRDLADLMGIFQQHESGRLHRQAGLLPQFPPDGLRWILAEFDVASRQSPGVLAPIGVLA